LNLQPKLWKFEKKGCDSLNSNNSNHLQFIQNKDLAKIQ
jgi:hypothetical protein